MAVTVVVGVRDGFSDVGVFVGSWGVAVAGFVVVVVGFSGGVGVETSVSVGFEVGVAVNSGVGVHALIIPDVPVRNINNRIAITRNIIFFTFYTSFRIFSSYFFNENIIGISGCFIPKMLPLKWLFRFSRC